MDEQKLRDILGQDLEVPDMVNKKLENTYSELEEKKRPAKRWGPRPVRMALIAAALAVGAVLCIAAGLPTRVYHFFGGEGSMTADGSAVFFEVAGEDNSPIVLKNGRLWFVNGEERTDITDLVDENTPYIYEHIDPVTHEKGYVIMGGTPEDFGWAEYVRLGDDITIGGSNFGHDARVTLEDEDMRTDPAAPEQADLIGGAVTIEDEVSPYRPWLQNAMDQLGIQDH